MVSRHGSWPSGGGVAVLYADHRGALVGYAGRLLGDLARAEEIVQEAFIRFSASAETTVIDEPVAYLYRTVRNLCLDSRRSGVRDRQRDQLLAEALGDLEGLRETGPTPESAAASRQELRVLQAAMAELPDRMRRALELHRFADLPVKQVAAELGVSVGTAHGLIVQALEHCRQRLDRP
ncbi:sigma-70 family RNA polymerase sigma factor [Thalassobaculum sp. OXR-137]|uniref:RNA polymerase sigma factor n=1 Tax=Thalassobaculum sp. OXR-137 TaxID=3100173 RepID=UPI002AC96871|nr:sigma-70 family RNA polymerase sigma factor [Thalassobaculum sp. OXR-137]WPZ32367.1 sigma-70 family RNA polymerase sigma factor [Thalassobaculum sp. OXR-137]